MALNTPPTETELQDAGTDLDVLDKFVNGAADLNGTGIVETRRGGPINTLAKIMADIGGIVSPVTDALADIMAAAADIDAVKEAISPTGVITWIRDRWEDLIGAQQPAAIPYADAIGEVATTSRYRVEDADGRHWRPRTELLPYTFPDPINTADLLQVFDLVAPVSATEFSALKKRVDRLDTFHPFARPQVAPIPAQAVEAGYSGVVVNLLTYVTDADTPLDELVFAIVGTLPTGLSLVGTEIIATDIAIVPRDAIAFTVSDGLSTPSQGSFFFEAYNPATPGPLAPVWIGTPLPDISVTVGQSINPFNYADYLTHADGNLNLVSVSAPDRPASLQLSGKVLTGVVTAAGTHTFSVIANHPSGGQAVITHRVIAIAVAPPAPPTAGTGGGGSGTGSNVIISKF